MKNIKIIGLLLGFACLIMITYSIERTQLYKKSLKLQIEKNCQQYKEAWMIKSAEVNDEILEITVELRTPKDEYPDFSTTPQVVEEISSFLFSDNYQYSEKGYTLVINLSAGEPVPVFIEVGDLTPKMNKIKLTAYRLKDVCNLSLRDFAEWYPNAVYIKTDLYLDNLGDLERFHQLKEIFLAKGITDEQREYILSLFPDIDFGYTEIKEK